MSASRAAWSRKFGGAAAVKNGRHKFGARALVVDGIRFDSTKEAKRYRELVLLRAAGAISDLEIHPMYTITVVDLARVQPGRPLVASALKSVATYTADFRYLDCGANRRVIEDVKSGPTKTTAYRLRKKLVEAIYGITISEV